MNKFNIDQNNDLLDNENINLNQYTNIMSVLLPTKGKGKGDKRILGSHYFMLYELSTINFNDFSNNLLYYFIVLIPL